MFLELYWTWRMHIQFHLNEWFRCAKLWFCLRTISKNMFSVLPNYSPTCNSCNLLTMCARVRAPWNSNYYTLDIFVLCTLLAVIVVKQMHSIYIWNCACITSMRWNCINLLAACYFVREFMCSCVSQITNWNLMHGTLHRAALTNFIFSQM